MPPRRDEATIFNVARRIGSPEARGVYVNVACGDDPELRRRVEALLRVHDESAAPLTSPTCVKELRGDLDHIVRQCLENGHVGIEPQTQSPPRRGHSIARLVRVLRRRLFWHHL